MFRGSSKALKFEKIATKMTALQTLLMSPIECEAPETWCTLSTHIHKDLVDIMLRYQHKYNRQF